MNIKNIRLLLLSISLILLQVTLFNNINLSNKINPMVYTILLFIYPLKEKKENALIYFFTIGIIIDIFMNTGGIHAFSLLTIAYSRVFFIRFILKKRDLDFLLFDIKKEPATRVIVYIFLMIFLHHHLVFLLEYFSLKNYSSIISQTFLTTILSAIIVIPSIYFFSRNRL